MENEEIARYEQYRLCSYYFHLSSDAGASECVCKKIMVNKAWAYSMSYHIHILNKSKDSNLASFLMLSIAGTSLRLIYRYLTKMVIYWRDEVLKRVKRVIERLFVTVSRSPILKGFVISDVSDTFIKNTCYSWNR